MCNHTELCAVCCALRAVYLETVVAYQVRKSLRGSQGLTMGFTKVMARSYQDSPGIYWGFTRQIRHSFTRWKPLCSPLSIEEWHGLLSKTYALSLSIIWLVSFGFPHSFSSHLTADSTRPTISDWPQQPPRGVTKSSQVDHSTCRRQVKQVEDGLSKCYLALCFWPTQLYMVRYCHLCYHRARYSTTIQLRVTRSATDNKWESST